MLLSVFLGMKEEKVKFMSRVCLLRHKVSYITLLSLSSNTNSFISFKKPASTVVFKYFVEASWICRKWLNEFSANKEPNLDRVDSNMVLSSGMRLPGEEKIGLAGKLLFSFFSLERYFVAAFRSNIPSPALDYIKVLVFRCVAPRRFVFSSLNDWSTACSVNI